MITNCKDNKFPIKKATIITQILISTIFTNQNEEK